MKHHNWLLSLILFLVMFVVSSVPTLAQGTGGCYYNQNGQRVCPRFQPGYQYNGVYVPNGVSQAPFWMPLGNQYLYSRGGYYTRNWMGGYNYNRGEVWVGQPYSPYTRDVYGSYKYNPNQYYWYYSQR